MRAIYFSVDENPTLQEVIKAHTLKFPGDNHPRIATLRSQIFRAQGQPSVAGKILAWLDYNPAKGLYVFKDNSPHLERMPNFLKDLRVNHVVLCISSKTPEALGALAVKEPGKYNCTAEITTSKSYEPNKALCHVVITGPTLKAAADFLRKNMSRRFT